MIILEITQSPDETSKGIQQFFFNDLYIGQNSHCELVVDDPNISPVQLKLFIKEGLLYCEVLPESNPSYFNQKEIKGIRIINVNDELQIGLTKIIVKAFRAEEEYIPDQSFQDKYEKIMQTKNINNVILQSIEKNMNQNN